MKQVGFISGDSQIFAGVGVCDYSRYGMCGFRCSSTSAGRK
nr:DUF4225 domain-containing protein [Photorhabdus asymbiotica]